MTRIKTVVIATFVAYWLLVVILLVAARSVFDQVLARQITVAGDPRPMEVATVLALTVLLSLLSVAVVRGWRWAFWLMMAAFFAGILRVLAAVLELTGRIAAQGPWWYVVLMAVVGLLQFSLAVLMLLGYRKSGVWGDI